MPSRYDDDYDPDHEADYPLDYDNDDDYQITSDEPLYVDCSMDDPRSYDFIFFIDHLYEQKFFGFPKEDFFIDDSDKKFLEIVELANPDSPQKLIGLGHHVAKEILSIKADNYPSEDDDFNKLDLMSEEQNMYHAAMLLALAMRSGEDFDFSEFYASRREAIKTEEAEKAEFISPNGFGPECPDEEVPF